MSVITTIMSGSHTDLCFACFDRNYVRSFSRKGISKVVYLDTDVTSIWRNRKSEAGLDADDCNPHSFRNTLALLAGNMCKTPGECKACSQNLGHENVLTTFTSYGNIPTSQQGVIIRDLARPSMNEGTDPIQEIEALLEKFKRR